MAGLSHYPLAVLICAGLATPSRGDLKIRVQETLGGSATSVVHYYKEHLWRIESEGGGGYTVVDWASKQSFTIDPARRQYVLLSRAHDQEVTDPTETIVVEIEIRDTGQERQMFGYAAHRFLTTERRHMEYRDRPPSDNTEIVTDGWYLDIPGQVPSLSRVGSVHVLTTTSGQKGRLAIPKIKVSRKGAVPKGFAVWEQTGDSLLEVTEFSEAPLEPRLFEVPAGFRRVVRPVPGESVSWTDQLILYWHQIEDWLGSL